MKRITIIGAGWLGLPLGARLAAQGHLVRGTTTREAKLPKLREAGLIPHLLDSGTARPAQAEAVMDCEVLIVTVPPRSSEPEYASFLNLIVRAAAKNRVPKVIYTSASSVYPDLEREVNEEDAAMIASPHSGVRLLAMEQIIRGETAFRSTILRLGGLFGPGRNPGRHLSGRPSAGAENPVNMVHLEDCVGAIRAVLEREAWDRVYNVVAPVHPSRRDFYDRACEQNGRDLPRWTGESRAWKRVSPERFLLELQYSFTYPDPLSAI